VFVNLKLIILYKYTNYIHIMSEFTKFVSPVGHEQQNLGLKIGILQ